MSKRPKVVTTFYVDGKSVWISEWYEELSDEKIQEKIKEISDMGYGKADTITDTTGRMVKV